MSDSDKAFTTLAAPAEHREQVGGSDFIALACRTDSVADALKVLGEVRARFPDATHHCWAYQLGSAYRFSDDGEPGGSAGAPVLRTIQGQDLDHLTVVVARYYGGTKLGVGGLMRAYGGTAAECLRLATRLLVRPRRSATARVPFAHTAALYLVLERFDVLRGPEHYDSKGLSLPLELYPEDLPAFAEQLRDLTRAQAVLEESEPSPADSRP